MRKTPERYGVVGWHRSESNPTKPVWFVVDFEFYGFYGPWNAEDAVILEAFDTLEEARKKANFLNMRSCA
jgi:hypothetical protein